ncbi:hypothetical protein MCUN1_000035 [Malassezia cuniculi]|uniref:rRNA-processing protein n=1 Tax=Malassezia cuniculi TaxID=948313 RepID=A0AAF0J493_9BASI|nr:hypothetical protein MCUN1_000035 [Malassezia cuniculi]
MSSEQAASTTSNNAQSTERALPPDTQRIAGKKVKTSWDVRTQERQRMAAVKARERQMREEKENEKNRKIELIRERQRKAEEKMRLEAMAAKMSAKKAARHARRMGRTKKVAH